MTREAAAEVLNFYRNCNYNAPSGTEEYEIANALNVILPHYTLLCAQQEPNAPLTLEELRQMDGEPVWVVIIDHQQFADIADAFDGWGLCRKSWVRVWDGRRADLVHIDYDFEDYGKTWLAYRRKPEEGTR